jgi:hypothetical protein
LYLRKGSRTAAFSGFLNGKGDFLSGIADMDIFSNLPEQHIHKFNF